MKQLRVTRRPRRAGGPGDAPADLPVAAASDTSAAARVIAAIDATLAP